MVTIVNYGMGNLGSIKNMFKYIGVEAIIESDIDKIAKASKILLRAEIGRASCRERV